MVWISKRERNAARTIVCQSRLFLSRRQRDRLKVDLKNLHNRLTRSDPFLVQEHAAASIVQKTYRSFIVRKFLRNQGIIGNLLQDDAIAYAHSNYTKRRLYDRQSEIDQMISTDTHFKKLIAIHLKFLSQEKIRIASKLQIARASFDSKLDVKDDRYHDRQFRLENEIENRAQIQKTVENQIAFAIKLRALNAAMSKRAIEMLEIVNKNRDIIKSVEKFVDGIDTESIDNEIQLKWIYDEREKILEIIDNYDQFQERIVCEEQIRLDNLVHTFVQSYGAYASQVSLINSLEGYEGEAFSLISYVELKRVEPLDGDNLKKWINRNGDKIAEVENELVNVLDEVHTFYCHQEDKMTNFVVFKKNRSEIKAFCISSTSSEIGLFDKEKWMQMYDNKPWVHMQEAEAGMKHLRSVQEHIRVRRSDLIHRKQTDNTVVVRKRSMLSSQSLKLVFSQVMPSQTQTSRFKQSLNDLGEGIQVRAERCKALVRELSRKMKNKSRIAPLTAQTPSYRDGELNQMIINVQKYMKQQQHASVAVSSLKFTHGPDETEAMNQINNENESAGQPFYQSRLEIGHHTQVVLWIQYSSKDDEVISHIALDSKKEAKSEYPMLGYTVVDHPSLAGSLWIKKDLQDKTVISSIQVAYANSSDAKILQKDYEKNPCCLTALDDCLVQGNLWTAIDSRYSNISPNVDIGKMEKELEEYKALLSEQPDDFIIQNIVTEMERRVSLSKRRQLERQGTDGDPLDYITDFCLLTTRDIKKLRNVFNAINDNNDTYVSVTEVMNFMKLNNSMISIISQLIGVVFGQTQSVHKLDFGQFAKGFCSIIMLGKDEMIKMVFNAIDEAGYGHIPKQSYLHVLDTINSKITNITSRVLKEELLPESLSFAVFQELSETYPSTLFPLFQFQQSLRQYLLGVKYWRRKIRKFHLARNLAMNSQNR